MSFKKEIALAIFIRHEACDSCGSSDGKAIYDDDSYYCWVCSSVKPSQEYLDEFKDKKGTNRPKPKNKEEILTKEVKPTITDEEFQEVQSESSVQGRGFRGIRDDTYKRFGIRHGFDETTGEVVKQFYPVTRGLQRAGYKVRYVPKDFRSIGATGSDCDLFGQRNFQNGGKYCLIVEGELDVPSAYEMLKDYYNSRGDFEVAVVSGTTGVKSVKQIAAQYKFFETFTNIVICMDNDASGQDSIEDIVQALPKGKVKVMKMQLKDPNEYLTNGHHSRFINDFFKAPNHIPVGVVASNQISKEMREEMSIPKVPLPPFMHELQEMMAGGIPLGRIVNLGSASGTGKSTISDEILYYMLFNSPHMTGVVTLESTVGQYGIKLLSRHISQKIELLDQEEAMALLDSDIVKQKEHELFNDEDGNPRFWLVDDRDGGVINIQGAIENLIISCGCKVIVLDPLSDIISKLSNEDQDAFMSWQKGMIKSHTVTFLNVCHTRKTKQDQQAGSAGANLHEEDLFGSSAVYKSAACNLMFSRNKEAEDDIERNTTTMKATKIRWTGKTGVAGKYYYDNKTHTLYDLEDYFSSVSPTEPV